MNGGNRNERREVDEAYPAEILLDPGASRGTRVRADEDPHDRERIRHADSRQAASMPKADRIGTTFHAGVKGEFVGETCPSGWNRMEPDARCRESAHCRTGPDRYRTDRKDRDVNMPKSRISINTT